MSRVLFDTKLFLGSLADDTELARELLAAFLEDCPHRVADLKAALEAGDALSTSKIAHSLKGMSGVVRVSALSELALDMEHAARDGDLESVRPRFKTFTDLLDKAIVEMNTYLSDNEAHASTT